MSYQDFQGIPNKMTCPAFLPRVPPDEHRDLTQFVSDPRTFTLSQISQMLSRLCMEINWDFFDAHVATFSKSCASDASALGLPYSDATFMVLWNEVLDVYKGHLKGLVMGGPGYDILYIVPRDRETGLARTTAVRMLGFMMGYFVGCRYGWVGDRFQATLRALLEGEDLEAYVKQHCHEHGLEYWEGSGGTRNRLEYLSNLFLTGDLGAATGIHTDGLVLTRWR